MCLSYLLMSIDQSRKFAVMKQRDPKEVRTTLETTYQKVSESLIDSNLTEIKEVKMETSETIWQ